MSSSLDLITPSKLIKSSSCLHAFHLSCVNQSVNNKRRDESDAEKLFRKDDLQFKKDVIESFPEIISVRASYDYFEQGVEVTSRAMIEGSPFISRGALKMDDFLGIPDLLQKVSQCSKLGDYSYIPVNMKNRNLISVSDRLQLFFYAFLLEPVLGFRPQYGQIALPGGRVENVEFTEKLEKYFHDLIRQMKKIRNGVLKTEAIRCAACRTCDWLPSCTKEWSEKKHVSLLSGLSATMVRKLSQHDIRTCSDLIKCTASMIQDILDVPLKSCERFVQAAKARELDQPIVLKSPVFPEGSPVYFYDIETFEDRVFCHGVVRVFGDEISEKCFFAESLEEEKDIWFELLDFLSQDEAATVYCWTPYEEQFVRRLYERYGGSQKGFQVLRKGLKDQCAFVREHFALPCRGYSIKVVAPFFNFSWTTKNANGMNCIAWYRMWLEDNDLEMKERIIQYNLDDVRAMHCVDNHLREIVVR